MSTLGFHDHDHDACVSEAIRRAESHCEDNGLRLTPVRRRALEVLLEEHRALGAYDLLAVLAEEGLGKQPPVAYRALDFLVKAGLVHKIEALNAFIACVHLGSDHAPAFLICRNCRLVAEADGSQTPVFMGEAARDTGFVIEHTVVEATGLCPACQDAA